MKELEEMLRDLSYAVDNHELVPVTDNAVMLVMHLREIVNFMGESPYRG